MPKVVFTLMTFSLLTLIACADVSAADSPPLEVQKGVPHGQTIRGADISSLPKVEDNGGVFYDRGVEKDPLVILRSHGVNYVRLKIWKDPVNVDGYNDLEHTVMMAVRAK